MTAVLPSRKEMILVVENEPGASAELCSIIERQLPAAAVRPIPQDGYSASLLKEDFDLVIIDYDMPSFKGTDLIHRLKLKDYEPAVLVVGSSADPRIVTELYSAGCHKFVVKGLRWQEELGQAARHLLRIRRLEEENRRLLARLTEANQMLEEKNRRLDEFSATVAHDIRGPLGGITMKIEYILESYAEQLNERCRLLLNNALLSNQRLADLVQAMYDFAKLGAKAASVEQVDLAALINEVVADMHFDDSYDIRIGVDQLPAVWGAPNLLRRVFINLISNAVKYCNRRDVVINIGLQACIETSMARFCEIYFEDNGPGIPKEEIKDIFSLFKRGGQEHQAQEGLGVGLSVVQRIIELHYGRITVESTEGRGAKFVMRLPMERIYLAG